MYPRNSTPTYENLIEYSADSCGVCWGFKYEPHIYVRTKWDETEAFTSGGVMITRNEKDFYFCRGGIDEAKWILHLIDNHPLNLNSYKFDELMIGEKVWWRSQPAVITNWIGNGQACVILEPDGIDNFITPPEFDDDDFPCNDENDIKTSIFDNQICWFRD